MTRAMGSLDRHEAISLREIRREDASALQPLASNPAIALTTRFPSPYPPNGAAEFVERALAQRAAGTHYIFAIVLDGAAIGTCGLMDVNRDLGQAEIGYWLGEPFWGRGFGFAACAWGVAWAFDNLPIQRLVANVVEGNVASEKILRRLGFRLESRPGSETEPSAGTAVQAPPGGRRLLFYRLERSQRSVGSAAIESRPSEERRCPPTSWPS
jgi:RimJ/RimL family protein N-acetyltransferase